MEESGEPKIIRKPSMNNTSYDFLFKISLIGDSGIGKTSLLLRFTDNVFKEDTISTIGVDFKIVSVAFDNSNVKMQIWDTCGSERFKGLTSSFIKSCNIFILVFDVTKHKSFTNLENWIKLIYENTEPKFMCLVGNKIDLEEKRQVTREEAIRFAEKNCLKYIETSAKTNERVEDVFLYVSKSLFTQIQNRKSTSEMSPEEIKKFAIGGNRDISVDSEVKLVEKKSCC
jgi:small GTP-binding protein